MSVTAIRILAIGTSQLGLNAILKRLASRGWGAHAVRTIREARDSLKTFHFDIVLAAEALPDGRGYDVSEIVAQQSITLLVGIALSESCLWLPVIEWGVKVLGDHALNADALEAELEIFLGVGARERAIEIAKGSLSRSTRPGPAHTGVPRRKHANVAAA